MYKRASRFRQSTGHRDNPLRDAAEPHEPGYIKTNYPKEGIQCEVCNLTFRGKHLWNAYEVHKKTHRRSAAEVVVPRVTTIKSHGPTKSKVGTSRFPTTTPPETKRFVQHEKWGVGIVIEAKGDSTRVVFRDIAKHRKVKNAFLSEKKAEDVSASTLKQLQRNAWLAGF